MVCSEKKALSGQFSMRTIMDSPVGVKRQSVQFSETTDNYEFGANILKKNGYANPLVVTPEYPGVVDNYILGGSLNG